MLKWYQENVDEVPRKVGQRVQRAGIAFKNHLREHLSRSQLTRGAGARKRGLDPSLPGEYPKKVMGHLRRNVETEYNAEEMLARVGTNVVYGHHLQTGTTKMKARPWMTKGLTEFIGTIRRILTT